MNTLSYYLFESIFKRWVYTTNHKRIGILYMILGFFSGVLAILLSLIIRLELAFPGDQIIFENYQFYNVVITLHGLIMLLLVIIPILFGGFGNYFVPILIGAADMAFPRLNNFSFWLIPPAILLALLSAFIGEGPGTGWTIYPPLSTTHSHPSYSIEFAILSVHLLGISSIVASINFICTIWFFKDEGRFLIHLPLFVWSILFTAILIIIALPVLAAAITMLLTDRNFGTKFYDPTGGGDVVLYQHIFWFFGHPEVYIIVLPAFGLVSQVLSTFSQKKVFGHKAMIICMGLIGLVGLVVWAHHMYTSAMNVYSKAYFTAATMIIALPTSMKVFNWLGTMWGGSLIFYTPMYFSMGFIILFSFGGMTGIILSNGGIDVALHDTYFVVGHFHYVLSMGAVFGIFSGFYYWIGKITGYQYREYLGQCHFWLIFIGANLTFFPMHFLGVAGMPRRYPDYPEMYQFWNTVASFGAFFSFFSVLFFFYVVYCLFVDKKPVPRNPWIFTSQLELLNRLNVCSQIFSDSMILEVNSRAPLSAVDFYEEPNLILNITIGRFRKLQKKLLTLSSLKKNTVDEFDVDFFDLFCELKRRFIVYSSLVQTCYLIDMNSFKTTTLEWTLPSPPPAHTFVVPPKSISTNVEYFYYKKENALVFQPETNVYMPLAAGIYEGVRNNKKLPMLNIHIFMNTKKSTTDIYGTYLLKKDSDVQEIVKKEYLVEKIKLEKELRAKERKNRY